MILESWRKASTWLGLSEMNQVGASCLLGLDGPSCIALGVVSSIDVLPCGSGEGSCLFGHGDHLGTGMGEVAAGGCSSTRGALVGEADWGDGVDCPNKTWQEVARFSLRDCGAWCRAAWKAVRKWWWLLLSSLRACSSSSCISLICSLWSAVDWEDLRTMALPMALE